MKLSDFGISRLSPSSLNSWAGSPSLWCLKYLFGWQDHAGPAAARGTAVEHGCKLYLTNPKTDIDLIHQDVVKAYEGALHGEFGESVDSELALLKPMLLTAIRGLNERGVKNLVGSQVRVSAYLPGIDEVEVVGYMDFVVNDGLILELKTTKRIPNVPRNNHLTQASFYRYARNLDPLELMYCSDRRVVFHNVANADVEKEIFRLTEDAKSLIKCLECFKNSTDMLSALPASGPFGYSREAMNFRKKVLDANKAA